ncbi:MAG: ATP-binding protein [Bacteroidota bacterium]
MGTQLKAENYTYEGVLRQLHQDTWAFTPSSLVELLETTFYSTDQRIDALLELIDLLHRRGRYTDVIKLIEVGNSWILDLEGEEHLFRKSRLLRYLGVVYERQNVLDLAEETLLKELQLLKQLPGRTLDGSYHCIATVYRKKLEYAKAYQYNQMAIEYAIQKNNQFAVAISHNNLGSLFLDLTAYHDAITHLEKCISYLADDPKGMVLKALAEMNLGMCHLKLGHYEEVEERVELALSVFEQHHSSYYLVYAKYLKLELLFIREKYDCAIQLAQELIRACELKTIQGSLFHQSILVLIKSLQAIGNKEAAINYAVEYKRAFECNIDLIRYDQYLEVLVQLYQGSKEPAMFENIAIKKIKIQKQVEQKRLEFMTFKAKSTYEIQLREKELQSERMARKLTKELNHKLIQVNTDLEQFAAIAAHDLKAPIRTIISYTNLLRNNKVSSTDQAEFLQFIQDAGLQMQELIDAILQLARSGQFAGDKEPVDLNAVLLIVKNQIRSSLLESGAQVIAQPLPTVCGQKTPLTQLFQNLICNSIKFMEPDKIPQILITSTTQKEHYLICLEDNGIGIPAQQLESIFDPFTRLNTHSRFKGSGIGLATCRKIMDHFGGKIWAESQLGQGTTIYLKFPKKEDSFPGLHL